MYRNCCNDWARNFSSLFTLEHRANYCWLINAIDRVLECSAAELQYSCALPMPIITIAVTVISFMLFSNHFRTLFSHFIRTLAFSHFRIL